MDPNNNKTTPQGTDQQGADAEAKAVAEQQSEHAEAQRKELEAELAEAQRKELEAELAEAKAQAAQEREARKAAEQKAAEAEAALKKSGAPLPITGSYKGMKFADGHRRVRNKQGQIGDSQAIMDAANAGDAEACANLDWLIRIKYAYLVPADQEPEPAKASKKGKK